ncbi:MAG: hypothetical protein ABIZ52_01780 [Candidatus Limnocylindrales bacterium]
MRTLIGVAVAALIIAGCGGTPTATASVAASTPSTGDVLDLPTQDIVPAGTYSLDRTLGITVDVPAGWHTCCDGAILKNDFAGLLYWTPVDIVVYTDPCNWADGGQSAPRGAAAIAAALSAQHDRQGSAPRDVTVAGRPGVHVRLTVPADQPVTQVGEDHVFAGCDGGEFRSYTDGVGEARYHQGASQIDDFYLLDVGSGTVVFDVVSGPDTPASDKAELDAMLASVRIR